MYNIEMRHCTIYEMKTKALVTAKLICVFVFAYAIADILLKWLMYYVCSIELLPKKKNRKKGKKKEKKKKKYIHRKKK